MKIGSAFFACCLSFGLLNAQVLTAQSVKRTIYVDETGQKISFELPKTWKFEGGIIINAKAVKAGEFSPGTIADCPYKTGGAFIKDLKAGKLDETGSCVFAASQTSVINKLVWTEGISSIPLWDGKLNNKRWYAHDFFSIINGKCFVVRFYDKQKALSEGNAIKGILASIKLI